MFLLSQTVRNYDQTLSINFSPWIIMGGWWYAPQISYKPSWDLCMRSYPVKEKHTGSAFREIIRYKQTDRQTEILLLYFKKNLNRVVSMFLIVINLTNTVNRLNQYKKFVYINLFSILYCNCNTFARCEKSSIV